MRKNLCSLYFYFIFTYQHKNPRICHFQIFCLPLSIKNSDQHTLNSNILGLKIITIFVSIRIQLNQMVFPYLKLCCHGKPLECQSFTCFLHETFNFIAKKKNLGLKLRLWDTQYDRKF